MAKPYYDVVAVKIDSGISRVMKTGLTEDDAEAYICMAVQRRGVEDEFYRAELSPATPSPPAGERQP